MSLTSKERGTFDMIDVQVDINERMEPVGVKFKAPTWSDEKSLEILGMSESQDLAPSDIASAELADIISMRQYLLADEDMNIYEAFVIIYKDPLIAKMKALRTIPGK